MKARAAKYNTPDFTATRDDRIARLKTELRQHVRRLFNCPVLSADWIQMTESLEQIAKVAVMESSVPIASPNTAAQQGRKEKGTLWDQEKEEISVRILLEEGKLNLCLRILNNFIQVAYAPGFDDQLQGLLQNFELELSQLRELCRTFEESCGLLLRLAFQHVEALQILDIPLTIEHCRMVLDHCLVIEQQPENCYQQTGIFMHYLYSIVANMEEMDDERIMDLLEQNQCLQLMTDHLLKNSGWFGLDELQSAALFFSHFFGSESYSTEPDRFINADYKKKLVRLKYRLFDTLASEAAFKKRIRPLLDNTKKWARKFPEEKDTPQLDMNALTAQPVSEAGAENSGDSMVAV